MIKNSMVKNVLVTVSLLMMCLPSFAEKVDVVSAKKYAANFICREGSVSSESEVKTIYYKGKETVHVVQFAKGGWVLIAADNMSQPIIGYSTEGVFQMGEWPSNVAGMMDWYSNQVVSNSNLKGKVHEGWSAVEHEMPVTRAASSKVEPLIKVNWNQTGGYQQFCPESGGKRAVVGCVAVGMAQAMSVAQYPTRPVGNHGYTSATYGSIYVDYDKEAPYDWAAILAGSDGKKEVARLLYHCGVSVNMDYSPTGSGTQTSYVAGALKNYFKYPASVKYYPRSSYEGDWSQLILNEIQSGRAVVYSGTDPNKSYGHCFNLDGYDGTFFHVNWGWGGANNGYFSLDALRDATMDMNYTSGQGAVVGVRPPSDKPSDIFVSSLEVEEKLPAGTVVGDVYVESEAEAPIYKFSIRGPYSVLLHTYMKAPFDVVDGKLVTTQELKCSDGDWNIEITATNVDNKASVSRNFVVKVVQSGTSISVVNKGASANDEFFAVTGARLNAPAKGISIVRTHAEDGSVIIKKVYK